jgi:RNA polymerase sigma factor (sigma-70 family)
VVNSQAFILFYRQQYPRLVWFLLKVGANESEAEDAAQEAMAQAIKAWERLDYPVTWVRRAAFTSYLRHAQSARREAPVVGSTAPIRESAQKSDIDLQEEQRFVISVMSQLPPAQRAVAALRYDGLTHEEIAVVLGKSACDVRSLWRHARGRLKEVIQSEGVGSQNEGS